MSRLLGRASFGGLVFNQSWEDPALDREALGISPEVDTVLSITSGGCSTLNLLCLRPRRLISVDANPAQSHLLELKLAAIRYLDHDDLWTLFGSSEARGAGAVYRAELRPRLSAAARRHWDGNIRLIERGLLTQGKLGFFLKWLRRYLHWQIGERRLRRFFEVADLDEQRDLYYGEIQPRLWRGAVLRLVCAPPVLALAGMPRSQYELIQGQEGIEAYIRDRVEYVLTSVPIRDNYFVAQAAFGSYLDRESVPPYLLARNLPALKRMADRVVIVTAPLADYLQSLPPGSIDKFNLMDIFDWMDPETLRATLRGVVRTGAKGGRFIYRSTTRSFPLPSEFSEAVVGDDDLARRLFARDRALTYSSFYVYRFRSELGASGLPVPASTPG